MRRGPKGLGINKNRGRMRRKEGGRGEERERKREREEESKGVVEATRFPPVCRHLSADVGSAPLCRRGEVTSTCFYRFPTGIERGVPTIMNVNINPTLYFRQLLTN